jgi:hypothetical protein
MAIIDNLNQFYSTATEPHADFRRPRINAVFENFFQGSSRTFHDFASSDLIGNGGG